MIKKLNLWNETILKTVCEFYILILKNKAFRFKLLVLPGTRKMFIQDIPKSKSQFSELANKPDLNRFNKKGRFFVIIIHRNHLNFAGYKADFVN